MRPEVYWLDLPGSGRLAIMPRPRAGDWLDDEIAGWREQGIDVIVSLLEAEEIAELGLQREAVRCHDFGMEFVSFPIPDSGVPATQREAMALAEAIITAQGSERHRSALPGRDRSFRADSGLRSRTSGD